MQTLSYVQVLILSVIQGAAELLPVSSSAHVIVAEKLMGLDPTDPVMTFLLVMLHTGTMFAVLWYFWPRWKARVFSADGPRFFVGLGIATVCTGVLGFGLKALIEKVFLRHEAHAEIESLFGSLPLVAAALFVAGLLILVAGARRDGGKHVVDRAGASVIGLVQGVCLPFRGFSRSGATISSAMLIGVDRALAEDFSFALAVILTPPVVVREILRLAKATGAHGGEVFSSGMAPGVVGMVFSFGAGLLALKLLSAWIEKGRWSLFGYYCLVASAGVLAVHSFR